VDCPTSVPTASRGGRVRHHVPAIRVQALQPLPPPPGPPSPAELKACVPVAARQRCRAAGVARAGSRQGGGCNHPPAAAHARPSRWAGCRPCRGPSRTAPLVTHLSAGHRPRRGAARTEAAKAGAADAAAAPGEEERVPRASGEPAAGVTGRRRSGRSSDSESERCRPP
jgi:hypothetical protein